MRGDSRTTLAGLWKAAKVVFGGTLIITILGGLSVGLVLGYHHLVHSKYFMVRKVVLTGIHRVTRDEILNSAGLDKPVNILNVSLKKMGLRVKAIPWVEDVSVTRKLPDTIIIEIKERRPRTLINLGGLYYLDESGVPFKKVDSKEKPELPIITGFTRDDFTSRADFTKQDLAEVFRLLDALNYRNDRFRLENISEINFDPARGLSLFTRTDNVQVKIGLGEYKAKIKRLGRVLAHLKIQGLSDDLVYFNLESSPRVIVRRTSGS